MFDLYMQGTMTSLEGHPGCYVITGAGSPTGAAAALVAQGVHGAQSAPGGGLCGARDEHEPKQQDNSHQHGF